MDRIKYVVKIVLISIIGISLGCWIANNKYPIEDGLTKDYPNLVIFEETASFKKETLKILDSLSQEEQQEIHDFFTNLDNWSIHYPDKYGYIANVEEAIEFIEENKDSFEYEGMLENSNKSYEFFFSDNAWNEDANNYQAQHFEQVRYVEDNEDVIVLSDFGQTGLRTDYILKQINENEVMVIRDYKYVVNSFSDMIKGIATLESHTTSSLPYIYNIHGSYLDSKHGYSETNYIYTRTYMTVNFVTGENVPTSWGNEDFNVNSIDDLKTYYKTYFDAIELAESDYRYVWSKITK